MVPLPSEPAKRGLTARGVTTEAVAATPRMGGGRGRSFAGNVKSNRSAPGKAMMAISARPASVAQRLLPILGWLPSYRREWLLPDVLAGLAVWAVMVPEGMAYSGIVGVPPIR